MKNYFLIIFLFSNILFSQTIIKGRVLDVNKKIISNASVLIKKKASENIIGFAFTNSNGEYSISFTVANTELDIEIRSLGFKLTKETIVNQNQTKDFQLLENSEELKEVKVRASAITQKGDTLKYSVNAFSKVQDRSIGDVLKRMPGIEVLSDGKILYQGKAINKYYINGLDLLEGKYNLANDNLPYNAVTQVQILENHQPIKALDSLKFSDNAAINIKLKKDFTFTGPLKLGLGFSPLLWNSNTTPMLFTKKRQFLFSYQTNNNGENVSSQIKQLTFDDLLNQLENSTEKPELLAIQKLSNPSISEKRWLNNNIHLFSLNYLQKLKKEYEVRFNFSYLNDYQIQKGATSTEFKSLLQPILIKEEKFNEFFYNSMQTNITLEKNAAKNYFKNNIEFQGFWDKQIGNINLNNSNDLNQNLKNNFFRFSNNLKTFFPLGKQLITINSFLNINNAPQSLNVNPGQFENLINNNLPYYFVNQNINLKSFTTNNSVNFVKLINKFSFEPRIGFQLENNNLKSEIDTSESNNLGNEFSNDLHWLRTKFYVDIQTQFKKNKFRFNFNSPINLNSFKVYDDLAQKNQSLKLITFEPKLLVIFEPNVFWKFNTSFGISNQFGNVNQLNYGYILQNYRSIQQNNSSIKQTVNNNYSIGITYKNPIKAFFINFTYFNIKSKNNLLFQSQISLNGGTELKSILQENFKYNHNFSYRISKYYGKLKTNISVNGNLGFQSFQQIINNKIIDISNKNLTIGNKIETDLSDWINIEYQANMIFSKNETQNQSNPTITQQNHLININFNIKNQQNIFVKSEYLNNDLFSNRSENLFTDIIYRKKMKNRNLDFEIQLSNLFNTTSFSTVNINDFSYIETNFKLRPRQILFKINFSI